MTTSQTTFLSKPISGEKVPSESYIYMRSRAKRRAYDLVMKEFKKSGITKAELARRLGKGADRVSRMLGGPGNWTISTVSDLLFAISGAEPKWELAYPLDLARRNDTRPQWLERDDYLSQKAFPPTANTAPQMNIFLGSQQISSLNPTPALAYQNLGERS